MAAIDVKWPSENEEFDTKAAAANSGETVQPSLSSEAPAPAEEKPAEPTSEAPKEAEEPEAPKPAATVLPTSVASSSAVQDSAKKPKVAHKVIEVVLVVLVLLLGVWSFMLVQQKADLQSKVDADDKKIAELNNNPAIVEQRKTQDLISKVSALIEVPKDETPQAALVSDATALKKQYTFFTGVQNGDEILFYYKAGKVIVYRPGTNKIVQTGPLTITQNTAPATTSTTKR